MASTPTSFTDNFYDYYQQHFVCESKSLQALREFTNTLPAAVMQSSPEQMQFFKFLVELTGAKHILEVGTFTGYSTLALAEALPKDGHITTLDVNTETTGFAKQHWQQAGVADKITSIIAPAVESLDKLIADGHTEQFDIMFIDADKNNYPNYYDRAHQLLRVGGVLAIDNVFWGSKIADTDNQESETNAIRTVNQRALADDRFTFCNITIGDGLSLLRKR